MEALMAQIEALLGTTGALTLTIAYSICIGSLLGFITVY